MNSSIFVQNSLKTIFEMLIDRKIFTEDFKYKYNGFIELLENNNKNYYVVELENDICVLYLMNEKFKLSDFKKITPEIGKKYNLLFIVLKENLTENNKKSMHTVLEEIAYEYQIFNIKELQTNITKHILQPKFEIISDSEEIKSVYTKYGLIIEDKLKQSFPFILKIDPISKYYGLKPGNLLKIMKHSETSGEYITYRVCV
jgi:DNA-directed RNA polymerases I, II, and III subunit RPABC1